MVSRSSRLVRNSMLYRSIVFAFLMTTSGIAQKPTNTGEVEISSPNEEGYRRAETAIANTDALVHTTNDKAFIILHLGQREGSIVGTRARIALFNTTN